MRFLVQRDARQPLVAFMVSYEVGQRDDPPGYAGIAHLVEHLSFRGSRHLGPYQGFGELDKVGALTSNGTTTPDNTVYYSVLPAQYLPLAFWVESERMGFSLERLSKESLALEAATVRKELLLRRIEEVEHAFLYVLFPEGHPYHFTAQRDAHAASLSDVQWFFQATYRPDRATVLIVGDVDPALAESLAVRYFGPIANPPNALARRPVAPRAFPGRERLTISRLTSVRRLLMAWPAPLPGSPDDLTLRVAATLARVGRASIESALRRAKLAEGAKVHLEQRDGAALLYVEPVFGVRTQFEATEYAVERYMADLGQKPPPEAALKVARDLVKRDILNDTENPLQHAWLHLDALRHGGRPFGLATTLARIDAVTPARISEFARKYWSPYHRFSTWYGDLRFEPTVPTGDSIQYQVFE